MIVKRAETGGVFTFEMAYPYGLAMSKVDANLFLTDAVSGFAYLFIASDFDLSARERIAKNQSLTLFFG
jgi:hypothetical protein